MPLKNWCSIHAWWSKTVWSIPYVSMASFFPSLKHNFIAYRSSKVSDCIFEIHQLWQSGFSRVYSNCCCSCSFESEIIKIGQSSHKMYSNNILNSQEYTTISNACTKKSGNVLNAPRVCIYIYIYIYKYEFLCVFLRLELVQWRLIDLTKKLKKKTRIRQYSAKGITVKTKQMI